VSTAYLIQTYHLPEQALRLATTIRAGSPDAVIVVSHDRDAATGVHPGLGDVADTVMMGRGGRGDFATIERYLSCLDWLGDLDRRPDWVVNITGQDYPVRPLADIEAEMASANAGAFLEFFPAMDPFCRWGRHEARDRYLFRYKWLRRSVPARWQKALRPVLVINRVQPYVRMTMAYGLAIGRRVRPAPFDRDLACYGGSFYGALSGGATQVVTSMVAERPELVEHFRHTVVPEEAFLQTLLAGSEIAVRNTSRRFYDFRGSVAGSPKVLTDADFDRVVTSDAWFARKFDPNVDAAVLDRLDALLLE